MQKTTCQICERDIKVVNGYVRVENGSDLLTKVISHHGYRRPGDGYQSASCFGARYLPYEVSCNVIQPCIESMKLYRANQERIAKDLMENPPDTLTRIGLGMNGGVCTYARPVNFNAQSNFEKGSWGGRDEMYGYEHASRVRLHRSEVRMTDRDIVRLEKRLANWKPTK